MRHIRCPAVSAIPANAKAVATSISVRPLLCALSALMMIGTAAGDPNGEGRPAWPRHDPAVDRLIHFTNSGVIIGTDPLKSRLDLWQKVWSRAH